MRKLLVSSFIVLVMVASGTYGSPLDSTKASGRFITVPDSLRIWTNFLTTTDTASPLWICLPQMAYTGESYKLLAETCKNTKAQSDTLGDPFPTIIALDLRGHGKSTLRANEALSFQNLPKEEFAKYPSDVKEVLQAILADTTLRIRKDEVTIIGASIGANAAAILTQTMPDIKRLVLLSPGMDFHGLTPADAVQKFNGKILLVASRGDKYSFETVSKLKELSPDHSTLLVFDGSAHGVDIINNDPKAMQAVVDWLLKK